MKTYVIYIRYQPKMVIRIRATSHRHENKTFTLLRNQETVGVFRIDELSGWYIEDYS